MAKNHNSTFTTSCMPKTGWHEPPRARDGLMRFPKGRRPLAPTNELRILMPVDAAPSAGLFDGEASAEDTSRMSLRGSSGFSESEGESVLERVEGSLREWEEIGDDGEEDLGAGKQISDASSPVDGKGAACVAEMDDDSDEEELLAGEERGDEYQVEDFSTPAASGSRPVPASKHRAKNLRDGTESIHPHPTDASQVIITYRYDNPAGGTYIQQTEMPKAVPNAATPNDDSGSIIYPDVETSKIPRTKKGIPWTPIPGTSNHEWHRGEPPRQENWRINIFFRRLNKATHTYQDTYTNTNILNNIDPNNKRFRTSYNKWILQFARRRDTTYTAKVVRVHWNTAERYALYTAINTFCARFGVEKFGFAEDCRLSTRQLQSMADAVNKAANAQRLAPRGVDAVRGQIASAHDREPPKNKAVFDLLGRAVVMQGRLADGEVVSRGERRPQFAIPLSEFPVDRPVRAPSSDSSLDPSPSLPSLGSRKRKRTAAVEVRDSESSGSELSSPPASEVGENENLGFSTEGTWMVANGDRHLGDDGERNSSDGSEGLVSAEEWVEEEEDATSRAPKKEGPESIEGRSIKQDEGARG